MNSALIYGEVTTAGFTAVLQHLKALARRWIATGGGGYNLANVAHAWTLAWGIMQDQELSDVLPYAIRPLLQQVGYHGETLRDAVHTRDRKRHDRLRLELHATLAALKQQVFPLHGLPS